MLTEGRGGLVTLVVYMDTEDHESWLYKLFTGREPLLNRIVEAKDGASHVEIALGHQYGSEIQNVLRVFNDDVGYAAPVGSNPTSS